MIILAAAACGGQSRTAVPIPSGPYYDLPANDAELAPIALAAAKALRTSQERFGGVVLGGQLLVGLSDSVARSIGAGRFVASSGTRVPFAVAREDPLAPSYPVGTVTFTVFRGGSDVAYVGAHAPSTGRPDGGLCITVVRSDSAWKFVERRAVRSPELCRPK
jgi:hypothetical protein